MTAPKPLLETRAIRLRPPLLASSEWVIESLERVAKAGFNEVILDVFFDGFTCFPTRLNWPGRPIRQHPAHFGADLLAEACARAEDLNLALYAGFDTLLAGRRLDIDKSRLARWRRGWHIRTRRGRRYPLQGIDASNIYLCPVNVDGRRLVGDLLYDVAEAYPVHGLFLDHLQWPTVTAHRDEICFCKACREGVLDDLDIDLRQIRRGHGDVATLRDRWDDWKDDRLAQLIQEWRARVNKACQTVQVMLHVREGSARGGLQQLAERNYADSLCVSSDQASSEDGPQGPLVIASYSPAARGGKGLPEDREGSLAIGFVYMAGECPDDEELDALAAIMPGEARPVEVGPLVNAVAILESQRDYLTECGLLEKLVSVSQALESDKTMSPDDVEALEELLGKEISKLAGSRQELAGRLSLAARLLGASRNVLPPSPV